MHIHSSARGCVGSREGGTATTTTTTKKVLHPLGGKRVLRWCVGNKARPQQQQQYPKNSTLQRVRVCLCVFLFISSHFFLFVKTSFFYFNASS